MSIEQHIPVREKKAASAATQEQQERIKEIRIRQASRSLEYVTLTRDPRGMYVITSYLGTSVCKKRETMLAILNQVLDVQDSYYAEVQDAN